MIMMKIFTSDNTRLSAMCMKNAGCFARHIVASILINEKNNVLIYYGKVSIKTKKFIYIYVR